MDITLDIQHVTKSFGATPVLTDVSLCLKAGSILGLAGENGAGKSTLARLISGRLRADSGKITLKGKCYVVPQEFAQIPTLTVFENIFLGREIVRNGLLDKSGMRKKTEELFSQLSVSIDPCRLASSLSVAEKQMLEIAKSFLEEANLLILDEPTTVLSKEEAQTLFVRLRELKKRGVSIIFVSHKLDEIIDLCDALAVLRDGKVVYDGPLTGMTPMDIATKMVGRSLSSVFPPKTPVSPDAVVCFSAEHLTSADGKVKDASFEIRTGEILGLAGLAGAGRTELAETICNLRKRARGKLFLCGKDISYLNSPELFQSGISYLSEDRQGTGLLVKETLTNNMTLVSLPRYCSWGFINKAKQRKTANEYIQRFRVKCDGADSRISSLSGGNQQKVAIAKGLDSAPKFFIFDEPTRGVDVGARREIYDFIHELAKEGVSCLMISSDMEELIGNCTRVLIMYEGLLSGEVSGDDITEENIILYATGVCTGGREKTSDKKR